MQGKHIKVGVGLSSQEDTKKCVEEAIKNSMADGDIKKPRFAFLFVHDSYNPYEVAEVANAHFGKDWVGTSADSQFNNKDGYIQKAIQAIVLDTDHMHFGVGYKEDYKENPQRSGEEAIKMALDKVHSDKIVDPYIQFRRAQTKSYNEIVKTPPYFIIDFSTGVEVVDGVMVPGMENEFLEGIFNVTGSHLPIVGQACSSDLDTFLHKNQTNLFLFADGKVLRHAALVVFVISNLHFSTNLANGYLMSNRVALATKLSPDGHKLEELNGKPALVEYSRLLDVDKEIVRKDPFKYTFEHPIGVIDTDGSLYIKEWMPFPDNDAMNVLMRLAPNSAITIVDYDQEKTINTIKEGIISAAEKAHATLDQGAISFVFDCCGRKAIIGQEINKEVDAAKKAHPALKVVGMHTFGEIGTVQNRQAQTVNQSVSLFVIYDKLLTE
ncbi:FIST C-terminal domain-containing protein [Candidatus Woesearchaeota archaeon]|nr:FIST C-terminal domain-containing protein [Candidatus Woesearchaeota archaeon]